MFKVPEQFRVKHGPLKSTQADGNNGMFHVHTLKFKRRFVVIASDGFGWEHVSVSLHDRTPTWEEMCFIKGLFWDEDDCVVQFHPPASEYVNNHPFCLHLWRCVQPELHRPPSFLVGLREVAA